MGILDDAIREHLELKRTHGASEDEIRRKEDEAFGPVRQDVAPAPEAAQPVVEELEPLEPAPEDPYAVHPGDSLVPDPDVPPAAEAGAGTLEPTDVDPGPAQPQHHDHDYEPHPALVDHDHIHSEEHPPEPVFRNDAPLDPAPVDDPPVGDPPVARHDLDEPPPRQSSETAEAHEDQPIEPPNEDVLEDTPEFLQDAPEHDRLWFEQKPPRDFDFGE
jgi:hypothetical protein